jgi:two-component system sensor histidine kinase QseC
LKSIKRTLSAGLLLGFGLLIGGGGLLIYYLTRGALTNRFDAKLRVEALAVITVTKQEHERVEVKFIDRYIREFDDDVATEFFQAWYPNGKTIHRSDSLKRDDLPQRFGTLEQPAYWNLTLPNGRPGRGIGLRFVPQPDRKERESYKPDLEVGLVVAGDRRDLDQALAALRNALLAVGAAGSAATFFLVALTLARGLAPLRRVADQAAQIDALTLRNRFPTDGLPVELVPICNRLNELLARLEDSFRRERSFSSDVAHELRTPIAELRSLADVGLMWPGDDQAATAAFKDTRAIARQMESIVTHLLAIARCESGKSSLVAENVDVRKLIEDLWRPIASRAAEEQLQVALEVPPGQMIESDRAMLSSILNNLIDNAVTYTPRGGSIRIAFQREQSIRRFIVINSVNDLAPDDLANLFERFWRKDASRSSSEHSGLGLSLCKAYADSLGMTLHAQLLGKDQLAMTLEGRSDGR